MYQLRPSMHLLMCSDAVAVDKVPSSPLGKDDNAQMEQCFAAGKRWPRAAFPVEYSSGSRGRKISVRICHRRQAPLSN